MTGRLRQQGIGEHSKSEDSWTDCLGSKSTCKKEIDWALKSVYSQRLSPLSFVLILQATTTTILHLLPFSSLLSSLTPHSLVP